MKRIAFAIVVIIVLIVCTTALADELIVYNTVGENVVRVQMRLKELGYFHFKPTGVFQTMTINSTIQFQQNQLDTDGQHIMSDGTIGQQTSALLFAHNAARCAISQNIPIGPGEGTNAEAGEMITWSEIKPLLKLNARYEATDFITGRTFYLKFIEGENHAEMECADAASTAELKSLFGGEFTYFKRAIILTIDGKRVASSIQGFPHGKDGVASNDMTGHLCVYFDGSISHVGFLQDAEHAALIFKAAGKS